MRGEANAVTALVERLEARSAMSAASAERHPDLFVREVAKCRVASYQLAIRDAGELLLRQDAEGVRLLVERVEGSWSLFAFMAQSDPDPIRSEMARARAATCSVVLGDIYEILVHLFEKGTRQRAQSCVPLTLGDGADE